MLCCVTNFQRTFMKNKNLNFGVYDLMDISAGVAMPRFIIVIVTDSENVRKTVVKFLRFSTLPLDCTENLFHLPYLMLIFVGPKPMIAAFHPFPALQRLELTSLRDPVALRE